MGLLYAFLGKGLGMDLSINSNFLVDFFKNRRLEYHFDDPVGNGKRQPRNQSTILTDRLKTMSYGSLITDEDVKRLSIGLPSKFSLREFLKNIQDQGNFNIATACVISMAITIRTNYINYQRYRMTRYLLGDKFVPVNPSVLYIHWNANIQNTNSSGISPSIALHLISIESHKIVDSTKYADLPEKLGKEPDLLAFYHASKSGSFEWFKLKPNELVFKLMLNKGYPIICAIVIYDYFLSMNAFQFGIIESPTSGDVPRGAQVILLTGYNEEKNTFEFIVPWGNKWGDDGYGTIPFDYILNRDNAGDFYYITYTGW